MAIDNIIIPATGVGGTANPTVECISLALDGSARQVMQIGSLGPNSAGTAISQGSGVITAGTQRVVLATDQPGVAVTGTFWQATQPVSGTVSALPSPTASSGAGITPIVSSTLEGSHVLKASAGNLYSCTVTTGATSGYLLIFNATSAPGDGAVTPIEAIQAPANSTVGWDVGDGPPDVYSIGITAVFSSTGPFTKTISATAFFKGRIV